MAGDGLSRGLSEMWRSVVLYLPSILVFLVILVVGYLLARLARTVTAKTLRRAGFDRAVQRGPAGRLLRPGAPSATDVCARLAFFVVLLFALQLAFGIFGPNPASDLINALLGWLPQVFVGIVIVVVTAAIAGAAHDLILAVLGGLGYARVLAKAVAAVIVTLGVIAGLDQVGIATSVTRPLLVTILATVAGVIIVGVGGGLIRPMQQRWEGWLDRAAAESAAIREQARAYAGERARQAAEQPSPAPSSPSAAAEPPAPPAAAPVSASPASPSPAVSSPEASPRAGAAATPFVGADDRLAPPAADGAGRTYSGGGAARSADPGRGGENRHSPDDTEELAWEARWAEEERRIREQDGDETQMISASPAGPGDDERTTGPHPDERTTDLHADGPTTALYSGERTTDLYSDERTTDLYGGEPTTDLGTALVSPPAETTILTPGVRPGPSPARVVPDDEATVPGFPAGGPSGAEPTTVLTAGPGADEVTVIRSPGPESGLQIVDGAGEERTQVVPLPAHDDDPTTETRPGGTGRN
ncbi:hypothetical protein FHR83_000130 [Actinoplanes campanulatus]|uniref:Uncharacterized protein n=1 Tax=Actinoplanes campanulatus TaxID=113559 RepID=A0A7W5AAA8_9ACTN|nr:hypothetical protein [Actinoplanes campanulatus]MBB3092496.1 hypothetical protein [Actinoplanes campanulatus]GGM96923.1 hypothetical protein GCM10010109_00540 [Actinoplanes campanulatus]GID34409.1 hypothetical protein Aca09nite_09150 [Actinoplanes campanulatus]